MSVFGKCLFVLSIVLAGSAAGMAQTDHRKVSNDTLINMHGDVGEEGREFNITIVKAKGQFKIVYVVNDSTNKAALQRDKDYKRITTLVNKGKFFGKIRGTKLAKYGKVFTKYQVNSTDSVSFGEDSNVSFANLITTISSKELKELKDDSWIHFDGYTVNFKIMASGKLMEFSVFSPNVKVQPLLTELISQTVAIYRTFKNQNLLARTRIKGF